MDDGDQFMSERGIVGLVNAAVQNVKEDVAHKLMEQVHERLQHLNRDGRFHERGRAYENSNYYDNNDRDSRARHGFESPHRDRHHRNYSDYLDTDTSNLYKKSAKEKGEVLLQKGK